MLTYIPVYFSYNLIEYKIFQKWSQSTEEMISLLTAVPAPCILPWTDRAFSFMSQDTTKYVYIFFYFKFISIFFSDNTVSLKHD